jgi:hypothetical protein
MFKPGTERSVAARLSFPAGAAPSFKLRHGFVLLPLLFAQPSILPSQPAPATNLVLELKDDRRHLSGEVARILQNGATMSDDLLAEIRSLLHANAD